MAPEEGAQGTFDLNELLNAWLASCVIVSQHRFAAGKCAPVSIVSVCLADQFAGTTRVAQSGKNRSELEVITSLDSATLLKSGAAR